MYLLSSGKDKNVAHRSGHFTKWDLAKVLGKEHLVRDGRRFFNRFSIGIGIVVTPLTAVVVSVKPALAAIVMSLTKPTAWAASTTWLVMLSHLPFGKNSCIIHSFITRVLFYCVLPSHIGQRHTVPAVPHSASHDLSPTSKIYVSYSTSVQAKEKHLTAFTARCQYIRINQSFSY